MDGRISITSNKRFTAFTLDLPPAELPRRAARREQRRTREGAAGLGAALLALGLLAGCGGGIGSDDDGGADDRHDRRQDPASGWSCRPPPTASTRPRSTQRPRPAWSRSARSSTAGAAEGSGFVLDADGRIVTNAHVVTEDPTRRGRTQEGESRLRRVPRPQRVPAKIVGFDPFADVALIEVEPDGLDLHPLALGDDSDLVVGQPVAAIGSPFGEQQSLSVGIVSATDRSVGSLTEFQIEGAIQTDASINPGNSGGPLLDARREVVGINQQIQTNSGANDGVGFAVPISAIKRSVAQLKRDGKVEYAYIGVSTQALYPQLAERARPRRRLRRPDRRSRPRRPGRRGRARGRRRQDPLPGLPGHRPAAT